MKIKQFSELRHESGTGASAAGRGRQELLACALLLAAPLMMASNVVIGRAATEVMPPVGLAFWRWLLALLLMLPLAWQGLWHHRRALGRQWPMILALGALGMGVCGAFVYVGLKTTTATNAGLIYAASPALILLIALMADLSTAAGVLIAPVSLGLALFIMLLEVLVAFIQAYIFTLLTAIFIGMYAHPAH